MRGAVLRCDPLAGRVTQNGINQLAFIGKVPVEGGAAHTGLARHFFHLNFAGAAPADSYLRFTGIGNQLEVSFDGGTTWQAALRQAQDLAHEEHFYSYWMPAPVGVTAVQIRGQNWWGGGWHAREFSLWSRTTGVSATPTATATAIETPLPTATATATALPTATATPTLLPTATPTATPSADIIFADSFESGDLNAWSARVIDGGDLRVSTSAAITGNHGLLVEIDDNKPLYLTDDLPAGERAYQASFAFDPNALAMANGDSHLLFYGYTGTATGVLRLEIRYFAGSHQLKAGARTDGSQWATAPNWFNISDAPHTVELNWWAADVPGANNGALRFNLDGVEVSHFVGIDNDTRRIDRIQWGPIAGIDNGTRGSYFLDDFVSRRLLTGSRSSQGAADTPMVFEEDGVLDEQAEKKFFLPLLVR